MQGISGHFTHPGCCFVPELDAATTLMDGFKLGGRSLGV